MSDDVRKRQQDEDLEQLKVAAYTASLCEGMAEIAKQNGLALLVYFLKMAKAEVENVTKGLSKK